MNRKVLLFEEKEKRNDMQFFLFPYIILIIIVSACFVSAALPESAVPFLKVRQKRYMQDFHLKDCWYIKSGRHSLPQGRVL